MKKVESKSSISKVFSLQNLLNVNNREKSLNSLAKFPSTIQLNPSFTNLTKVKSKLNSESPKDKVEAAA